MILSARLGKDFLIDKLTLNRIYEKMQRLGKKR